MIRRLSDQGNTNEMLSYLFTVVLYGLAAFSGQPKEAAEVISFLNLIDVSESFRTWADPILIIIGGLLLSYSVNRLCRRHKLIGKRTQLPILISSLYGSLLPDGQYGGTWLLIGLMVVWLFDAIFNLQEHEKRNLNSLLFSGSLLSVIVMLNKDALWLIPVIFLAIALFLFLNLRRISALAWAGFVPFFILSAIVFLTDKTAFLINFISSSEWVAVNWQFTTKPEQLIAILLMHLTVILGLFMMIFNYNSNASKQRKMFLLLISMTVFYLLGGLLLTAMRFPQSGLMALPAIICSSYFYSRGSMGWLVNIIFYLQLISWLVLVYQPDSSELLSALGL